MAELSRAPQEIRVSRFCGFATQRTNPARPLHMIYHALSGDVLKASAGTASFIRSLAARGQISRREILATLSPGSLPILDLFFDKRILVPAGEEESIRPYLDQYPVARGFISYKNSRGRRVHVLSETNLHGQKSMAEYAPDPFAAAFLEHCAGEITLRSIAQRLSRQFRISARKCEGKIWRLLVNELSLPHRQAVKLLARPYSTLRGEGFGSGVFRGPIADFSHSARSLAIKARARNEAGTTNLKEFHRHGITEAFHEFEAVEITVSHAFRAPNAALGGLSYGASFFEAVQELSPLRAEASILEVGGGTGVFAREFLSRAHRRLPQIAPTLHYGIADIAPALRKSQAAINRPFAKQISFSSLDAERLRLAAPVDLLLANEVVADLRTVLLRKKMLLAYLRGRARERPRDPVALAMFLIRKYQIPFADAPEEFYFNLGTALFLERIRRTLKTGGAAILTEFGEVASYPSCTHHLNHDEYSIHWGQMAFLAKQLGFARVELLDLPSLLPFDPRTEMFAGDFEEIRYVFKKFGLAPPPLAAYPKEDLEKILESIPRAEIGGLEYLPLRTECGFGPSPWEFKALVLRA